MLTQFNSLILITLLNIDNIALIYHQVEELLGADLSILFGSDLDWGRPGVIPMPHSPNKHAELGSEKALAPESNSCSYSFWTSHGIFPSFLVVGSWDTCS